MRLIFPMLIAMLALLAVPLRAQEEAVDLSAIMVRMAGGEAPLDEVAPEGPVILHFWATWCAPCRTELPEVAVFARLLEAEGLGERLVLVSVDRSDYAAVAAFLAEELGLDLETVQDNHGRSGMELRLFGYPSTVLLDAGRAIVRRFPGAIAWTDPAMQADLMAHLRGE